MLASVWFSEARQSLQLSLSKCEWAHFPAVMGYLVRDKETEKGLTPADLTGLPLTHSRGFSGGKEDSCLGLQDLDSRSSGRL